MGLMRRILWVVALISAMWSAPAWAQFANNSIGLSGGYMSLSGTKTGIDYGIPFGITASHYLESGWDLVFELGAMIVHVQSNILALDITPIGVRYLFMEETFR